MPGTWTVDPKTLVSLRLSEAERAIEMGDLDRALIEAEELLDEQPSHRRALEISSEAALGMGDILTALASLNRFVELHPPDARTLQALAAARFQAVDFPGALAAAEGIRRRAAPPRQRGQVTQPHLLRFVWCS